MVEIKTQGSSGVSFTIDECDYEYVSKYKWYPHKTGKNKPVYIIRYTDWNGHYKYLHRELMNPLGELVVDHADGNTLNNTRSNLRLCSRLENQRNRKIPSQNTSGYKGVSWDKKKLKWGAYITYERHMFLGYYDSPELAYEAYCNAAQKYFGEYFRAN